MTDRPIIFSAPMVRALLAGRKTQTRRLATSPLARAWPGDRLYVREAWKAPAIHDRVKPRDLAPSTPIYFMADDRLWPVARARPGMHLPRWASRLTLIVEEVRVEPLHAISTADVLAEGAPLDPNHRDTTQDGSNPVMCIGERPWVSQSPRAWYHRLWDALHDKDGQRWDDDPDVVVLTFAVERRNIDR